MVLESTMICVDNSDYMRNGDFVPTRLQAQEEAVNLICHSKTRAHPENNVGLILMAKSPEVLVTLTTDVGRILSKLHQVGPDGNIKFCSTVRVAHLALKHRQGKTHRQRIIAFVGSPVGDEDKDIVKLAKKLKKEKVNVDVINFGEQNINSEKLKSFINTINGKEGTGSNLVTVPPGPMLSDALMSSSIVVGEDGSGAVPGGMSGFEFGIDPNEDPELALALRVSMEEQRAKQEDEARKVAESSKEEVNTPMIEETPEEVLLKKALELSMQVDDTESASSAPSIPDFNIMSEEEQIQYALRMSMQQDEENAESNLMETEDSRDEADDDFSGVINDPVFLQTVLENLPGVDPQSEAIRNAMGALTQKDNSKNSSNKKTEDSSSKDEPNKKDEKK